VTLVRGNGAPSGDEFSADGRESKDVRLGDGNRGREGKGCKEREERRAAEVEREMDRQIDR